MVSGVIKACLHGAIATAIYLLHLGASLGTLAKTKLGSGMSANTFIFKPMILSKNYLCNDFLSKSVVIPDRMLLG